MEPIDQCLGELAVTADLKPIDLAGDRGVQPCFDGPGSSTLGRTVETRNAGNDRASSTRAIDPRGRPSIGRTQLDHEPRRPFRSVGNLTSGSASRKNDSMSIAVTGVASPTRNAAPKPSPRQGSGARSQGVAA